MRDLMTPLRAVSVLTIVALAGCSSNKPFDSVPDLGTFKERVNSVQKCVWGYIETQMMHYCLLREPDDEFNAYSTPWALNVQGAPKAEPDEFESYDEFAKANSDVEIGYITIDLREFDTSGVKDLLVNSFGFDSTTADRLINEYPSNAKSGIFIARHMGEVGFNMEETGDAQKLQIRVDYRMVD